MASRGPRSTWRTTLCCPGLETVRPSRVVQPQANVAAVLRHNVYTVGSLRLKPTHGLIVTREDVRTTSSCCPSSPHRPPTVGPTPRRTRARRTESHRDLHTADTMPTATILTACSYGDCAPASVALGDLDTSNSATSTAHSWMPAQHVRVCTRRVRPPPCPVSGMGAKACQYDDSTPRET